MTHVELQEQTLDLTAPLGWGHLHVRRSIGKGRRWVTSTNLSGWPDLLLWSTRQPGRHLAVEVKVPPDDLASDQLRVAANLLLSGFEYLVVRPEAIVRLEVLRELAVIPASVHDVRTLRDVGLEARPEMDWQQFATYLRGVTT